MGERHIQTMLRRFHGLRRPDRSFRGRIILGEGCILGWDHAKKHVLLQQTRM
jgi:hypothetical protein